MSEVKTGELSKSERFWLWSHLRGIMIASAWDDAQLKEDGYTKEDAKTIRQILKKLEE